MLPVTFEEIFTQTLAGSRSRLRGAPYVIVRKNCTSTGKDERASTTLVQDISLKPLEILASFASSLTVKAAAMLLLLSMFVVR